MTRITTLLAFAVVLLPGQIPWWGGTWKGAFEEARKRNVPLIVGFVQDGEEANDRIVAGLYQDRSFHKLCERVVPIITCMTVHAPRPEPGRGTVCSRFGWLTCSQHKALEMDARAQLWNNKHVKTPSHVILLPDGTEIARLIDVPSSGEFESAVQQGRKKLGRGLTTQEFKDLQEAVRGATGALRNHDVPAAVKFLETLETLGKGTPFDEDGKELRAQFAREGAALVEKATALHARQETVAALRLIGEVAPMFKGTPAYPDLQRLEAKIKRTREGRDALVKLRKEELAKPHFEKAQEAERERDYLRAYVWYHKAVTSATDTPLGDAATERIGALVRDPDIGKLIADRREKDAARALATLKRVLDRGDRPGAKRRLQRMEKLYFDTPALAEGRKLVGDGG